MGRRKMIGMEGVRSQKMAILKQISRESKYTKQQKRLARLEIRLRKRKNK